MLIRIERIEFNITNDDIIMDNSACYQLITQTYRKGWHDLYPIMSKTQFNKLLKENKLVLFKEKFDYYDSQNKAHYMRYYKFNVEE